MIAGMDNLQARVSYDGIARAGRPRLQPATWLGGDDDFINIPSAILVTPDFTVAWSMSDHDPTVLRTIISVSGVSFVRYDTDNLFRRYLTKAAVGYYSLTVPSGIRYHTRHRYAWTARQFGGIYTHVLYIDGVPISTDTPAYAGIMAEGTMVPIIVGRNNSGTNFFRGVVCDLIYYNRALTPTEIVADVAGSPPLDMAGWWKGHGNTDDAWRNQVGTAHGTVYGSPARCLIREGDGAVILNNQILTP